MCPYIRRQFETASIPQRAAVTGPFRFDPDVIADIEKDWVKSDQLGERLLPPVDMAFMNDPIKIIPQNGIAYPTERLNNLISNSSSRPQSANASLYNNFKLSPQRNLPGSIPSYTSRTAKYVDSV